MPRWLQVFGNRSHDAIVAFSEACGAGVQGMVLHDQPEVASRPGEYLQAVTALDQRLRDQGPGPMLFIEYACGLEVEQFIQLFHDVRDCGRVPKIPFVASIGRVHVAFSRKQVLVPAVPSLN